MDHNKSITNSPDRYPASCLVTTWMNLQLRTHDAAMRAACSCSSATTSTCCGLPPGSVQTSHHDRSIVTNTVSSMNVFHCGALRPHGSVSLASLLLTVSLFARTPRRFPAALRGLPSRLPVWPIRRRAGRALRPGRPAPRLVADSSGKRSDGPAGVRDRATRQSRTAERRLTLCRRRSCRRPGPARRSCRGPPLLLLCVGGGGPTRHTQCGYSCPGRAPDRENSSIVH